MNDTPKSVTGSPSNAPEPRASPLIGLSDLLVILKALAGLCLGVCVLSAMAGLGVLCVWAAINFPGNAAEPGIATDLAPGFNAVIDGTNGILWAAGTVFILLTVARSILTRKLETGHRPTTAQPGKRTTVPGTRDINTSGPFPGPSELIRNGRGRGSDSHGGIRD